MIGKVTPSPEPICVDVVLPPAEALRAIGPVAEVWGGSFEPAGDAGGRLEMPVLAGLRRGWVVGTLDAEASGTGTRLRFRAEDGEYRVERGAVAVLLFAASGAGVVLAAPLVPALVPALPVAALTTFAAWLFIVSRLRNSGPEELLASLDDEATGAGNPAE